MNKLKFTADQIAIRPTDPTRAVALLVAMNNRTWVRDTVNAEGAVHGIATANEAELQFNYELSADRVFEFEVLNYTKGANWVDGNKGSIVSHFGMHCAEEDINRWKAFFHERGIGVVQEVYTKKHTNANIKDTRRYHYCIFGTRDILGVDLKFIVRKIL